jgi:hypothetical protein
MIRWYDYIASIVFAYGLLSTAFTIPFFGYVLAWVGYEYGWVQGYCVYRKEQER